MGTERSAVKKVQAVAPGRLVKSPRKVFRKYSAEWVQDPKSKYVEFRIPDGSLRRINLNVTNLCLIAVGRTSEVSQSSRG
jgi:hypothetical protein